MPGLVTKDLKTASNLPALADEMTNGDLVQVFRLFPRVLNTKTDVNRDLAALPSSMSDAESTTFHLELLHLVNITDQLQQVTIRMKTGPVVFFDRQLQPREEKTWDFRGVAMQMVGGMEWTAPASTVNAFYRGIR